jgi:hypothetical protein
MALIDLVARVSGKIRLLRGKSFLPHFDMAKQQLDPSEGERLAREAKSDLGRLTFGHRGRLVHKWTHYPDIYERHFSTYRGNSLRMLEIGVFKGGSLEVWRNYFGERATIFGIDIDPACAEYADPPNQIRIGSQADPAFLNAVVKEMGGIDLVLDDGSHVAEHQEISFRALFPLLSDGGLYIIEDMHTSYWAGGYSGGYRRRGTAIELVKQIIDDMHGWYHDREPLLVDPGEIVGVHVYDSIAVIEKGRKSPPQHVMVS